MSRKKYVVYTRISDDEYDKSLDNQDDIIRKVAEEKGILRKDCIVFSETKS